MTQNRTLSEFQALYGNHDNCFLSHSGTRLRVDTLTGCTPMQHGPMQRYVAEAIDDAERDARNHSDRRSAQRRRRYGSSTSSDNDSDSTGENAQSAGNGSAAAALDEMLDGDSTDQQTDSNTDYGSAASQSPTVQSHNSTRSWVVPPSNVELLEIGENTTVKASIWPRTVRCGQCDHYEFLDASSRQTLSCSDRGCSGTLYQYPIVFVCPRCASVDPLQPQAVSLDEGHVGPIACADCADGHYHLHHDSSLTTAEFRCSSCGDSHDIERYCPECHIPSDESGNGGAPSVMKPTPVDASSIVSPMSKSALYLQDEHISLDALHATYDSRMPDPYAWGLDELGQAEREILRDFWGLTDLFTVPNVTSLTAVYGYQTRVSAQGTDISDAERLTQTFDHRNNMKRAYVVRTTGRGLVFDFDVERLYAFVADSNDTLEADNYEELASGELAAIEQTTVKDLVDGNHELLLVPLLHALEHGLYDAAGQEIGMDDVLGSKLLVEDGAVILYEREEVGAGGLAQLTLDESGGVLKKFLRNASEQLAHCGQLCTDGCPSCIYIDDFHCRPYLPTEVSQWIPPNALLDRDFAAEYIHAY